MTAYPLECSAHRLALYRVFAAASAALPPVPAVAVAVAVAVTATATTTGAGAGAGAVASAVARASSSSSAVVTASISLTTLERHQLVAEAVAGKGAALVLEQRNPELYVAVVKNALVHGSYHGRLKSKRHTCFLPY